MHKKLEHAAIVIAAYVLLYCIFFAPVLFSGRILAYSDSLSLYLPSFLSPVSLWEPNLQGGFPVAADSQNATWYPIARLFALFGFWNGFVISAYVLLSCFTYAYVYHLTKSWVGGAVSGIVAGMSGFAMAHLCHTIVLHGMVWIPLVLLAIDELKIERRATWFALGSGGIALSLLSGHPQIPTYGLIVAGFYALTLGLFGSNRPIRFLTICAAMFIVGLSLAAIQLIPLFELVSQSVREKPNLQFFQSISLKPLNLTTFVFPSLFGTPDTSFYRYRYFGAINFIERTFYPGILTILLSFVAVQRYKDKRLLWFWIFIFVISLLLALGDTLPFGRLLFFIPGLNSFRVPARHVYEMILALTVLAGFGAAVIHQRCVSHKEIMRSVIFGIMIFIFAALAIWLNANKIKSLAIKNGVSNLELAPWANLAITVPIISFFVVCIVLFFYARKPSTLRASLLIGALILDLASIGFFGEWKLSPKKIVLRMPATLDGLPEKLNKTHQRFLPVRGVWSDVDEGRPNLTRLWSIANASGYGSLPLKRINELLAMPAQGNLGGNWMESPNRSLDLMAVRYVSTRIDDIGGTADPASKRWHLVRQFGNSVILENRRALPRAWLVSKVVKASGEQIRKTILTSRLLDGSRYKPDEIAFVEENFAFDGSKVPDGKIRITNISKSDIEIKVETANQAFLVLSDVYYPGWIAKINNTSTHLYRTNYLFRGILVPAGSSTVQMEYRPTSFRLGLVITSASFLLLAFIVIIKIPRR